MDWRHTARLLWQTALTVSGCLILLFLLMFLYGALRAFVLGLIVPLGAVISEAIGRHRWQFIKDAAAECIPYVAFIVGALTILYFVRWINRRGDPQCADLPHIDFDSRR